MNTTTQPTEGRQPLSHPSNGGYRLAVRAAAVAGVFSIVVAALLLADYVRREAKDPSEDQAYQALKAAVALQPDNEAFKARFRELDLHLRAEYFRQRRFATVGTWLLLCGVVVFLIAAKSLLEKNPNPTETEARYWLAGNLCRCTGYDKIIKAVLDTAAEMRRA